MGVEPLRTAYLADRAAALAGIPRSTLHYWARTELLVPSVSAEKVKLWSLEDLMALRVIDWLRRDKEDPRGEAVEGTPTPRIRRALTQLKKLDQRIWSEGAGPAVKVDKRGNVYTVEGQAVVTARGQRVLVEVLDLLAPFHGTRRIQGPDLRQPRPHLRIVQGKLAGEPHVEGTRVETRALSALAARGFSLPEIAAMYPFVAQAAVKEAIALEAQLASNLAA